MDASADDNATPRSVKLEEAAPPEKMDDGRTTYKSFKKKFKKMRIVFEETMRNSNELILNEQRALATIKRLAQENNQLLDLLLDVNSSLQIPADKCFDLSLETPALSPVPPLVSSEDLSKVAELNTPAGKAVYNEICSMLAERDLPRSPRQASKALATMLENTPHLSSSSPHVAPELKSSLEATTGELVPLRYLAMENLEEYLYEIDTMVGSAPPANIPYKGVTYQDVVMKNPHSVYNWLRIHEPKVFLQDGEGSEKSQGKPGALRGAGKRASVATSNKPDVEFIEEDGMSFEAPPPIEKPTRGKRKRVDDDDGGYHPKSGRVDEGKIKKPRQPRKKKGESSTETAASTGSAKRGRKPKIPSPPPGAHPFGPM